MEDGKGQARGTAKDDKQTKSSLEKALIGLQTY